MCSFYDFEVFIKSRDKLREGESVMPSRESSSRHFAENLTVYSAIFWINDQKIKKIVNSLTSFFG